VFSPSIENHAVISLPFECSLDIPSSRTFNIKQQLHCTLHAKTRVSVYMDFVYFYSIKFFA
jgi:hypothetical protein